MKKAETQRGAAARTVTCILIGFVAVLLALVACSLGVLTGALAAVPYAALSSVCLFVGCLLAAWRAARCSPGQKLLWALASGGGLLLCLIGCSLLCCGGTVEELRLATNTGCALAASLLGGLWGAAGRRKKKKR